MRPSSLENPIDDPELAPSSPLERAPAFPPTAAVPPPPLPSKQTSFNSDASGPSSAMLNHDPGELVEPFLSHQSTSGNLGGSASDASGATASPPAHFWRPAVFGAAPPVPVPSASASDDGPPPAPRARCAATPPGAALGKDPSGREVHIRFETGACVTLSELAVAPSQLVPTVRVAHGDVASALTRGAQPTVHAARAERGLIFEHAAYILQYAATYQQYGPLVLEGATFEWVDGVFTCTVPPGRPTPAHPTSSAASGTASGTASAPPPAATTRRHAAGAAVDAGGRAGGAARPPVAVVPVASYDEDEDEDDEDDEADDEGEEDDQAAGDPALDESDDLDALVSQWARLKLETRELRSLCETAQAGLQKLESSNDQIRAALASSGYAVPVVELPAGMALARGVPSAGPATRVLLPIDHEGSDDGAKDGAKAVAASTSTRSEASLTSLSATEASGSSERAESLAGSGLVERSALDMRDDDDDDDDEAPVYRDAGLDEPPMVYRSLGGQPSYDFSGGAEDDNDDDDDDDELPIYRSAPPQHARTVVDARLPKPAPPSKSAAADAVERPEGSGGTAGGKRGRSYDAEVMPEMLQPCKQSSDPSARSSPLELDRKLEALKESIREERRERARLLQVYHDNEVVLARLQAANRELMRQVALLKSGAPVPRAPSEPQCIS